MIYFGDWDFSCCRTRIFYFWAAKNEGLFYKFYAVFEAGGMFYDTGDGLGYYVFFVNKLEVVTGFSIGVLSADSIFSLKLIVLGTPIV